MTQDDSHSYVTPEQAPDEIKHLLELRASACSRTSGSTTSTSSCRPATTRNKDKFVGTDEEWAAATQVLEDVAAEHRARAGARPGRRGVLRPQDLGAGARRDRPDLADVDHPVRLQPARAASGSSTRRPTAPGSGR